MDDKEKILAMEREIARLKKLLAAAENAARVDALTGALNRRGLDEEGEKIIALASRTREMTLSVIFTDIEDFGTINNERGHEAGDEVLRRCVRILKKYCRRATDSVGRYGGDEFVLILLNTSLASAQGLAKKIQTEIPLYCGVAEWKTGMRWEELLSIADPKGKEG